MRGLRADQPPTLAQLLVLADRAERGPLTAAEAARLRVGIAGVHASSRAIAGRAGVVAQEARAASARLVALRHLVDAAKRRGARVVSVMDLETVMRGAVRPPEASAARQGPSRRRVA